MYGTLQRGVIYSAACHPVSVSPVAGAVGFHRAREHGWANEQVYRPRRRARARLRHQPRHDRGAGATTRCVGRRGRRPCDIILLSLPDSHVVESVVLGPDGVLRKPGLAKSSST